MQKSKVYFTKQITPEALVKMYEALGLELRGRVAVKLHSGEVGNQNFLRPEFMEKAVKRVGGTIVECNTAYEGARNTTKRHIETMKNHGWSSIAPVDILDSEAEKTLKVDGLRLKENYVGANIDNYDSMLVLSHFKGHPMGGFGGAIKNIAIGLASSHGKRHIHGAGNAEVFLKADHDSFLEAMADAAKSIVDYFGNNICYVNVMKNMSVDCDCCAVAEDPKIADIGILSSLDPLALDKACVDLVFQSEDEGKVHLIERINSRNGLHTLDAAQKLGVGSMDYQLIEI